MRVGKEGGKRRREGEKRLVSEETGEWGVSRVRYEANYMRGLCNQDIDIPELIKWLKKG